ncbi:MAG: NUDIX domain-containing protein [Candidatus Binatia bacterium]
MSEHVPAVAHPAATVVLLRDGAGGCEVLLVRRNARLAFHGGAWVFPGGRVDPEDYTGTAGPTDIVAAARNAAVREAREEAGVTVRRDDLVPLSRWITPAGLPKRFDAWFFAARAASDTVQVDGSEIHAHRWIRPAAALAAHGEGQLDLPPPTFVTLTGLAGYCTAAEALAAVACRRFETFVPRLHAVADGACTLYAEDAGYETGRIDEPGPRHRLWMLESGWRYERTGVPRPAASAAHGGSNVVSGDR